MDFTPAIHTFLLTLGYTIFGLIIFGVAFWIIVKICPFSMRKEIEEDQNISLSILLGAIVIGMAIIIAASVSGG